MTHDGSAMFAGVDDNRPSEALITQEYVSSMSFGPKILLDLKKGRHQLPQYIDDLQRTLRFDIYEQMLLDPQIKSCLGLIVAGVMGGGLDVIPASESSDPEYKSDVEWSKFVERCLIEHLQTPLLTEVMPDMLKAAAVGYRVAEKVCFPVKDSPEKGRLIFKSLRVKPRKRIVLVVDDYMNVLGIAQRPITGQEEVKVIPREKFLILSWKPTDADPRGTSDLRSVYEAWWRKQRMRPQHLQFLSQYASPSLIGTMSSAGAWRPVMDMETGQPKMVNGKPVYVDQSKVFMGALEKFQNSSIIVIPFGAKVDNLEVSGNGEAFLMALNAENHEIAKGILYATLATEQGDNQGRAASSVHADVVSVVINYAIEIAERMLQELSDDLIRWNAPDGTRSPRVRLPGANKADFLAWASAIAKLEASAYLHPSQYAALDAMLNLPKRTTASIEEAIKAVTKDATAPPPGQLLSASGQPITGGGTGGGKPISSGGTSGGAGGRKRNNAKEAAKQDNRP